MNCADAEKCIALDVEGDLAEARVAALRNHLAVCAPCEQFAQEMRESQQVLKSLRHEMPPESLLSGSRQAALEELRTQPRNSGWGWALQPRLRWVYAAGGLAVMAWATMGWLAVNESKTPKSVVGAVGTRNEKAVAKVAALPGPVTRIRARDESTADMKSAARNVVTVPLPRDPSEASPNPASGAPLAPRVEIVSTSFSNDSPDLDSDTTVLKIASNNSDVLLYWVMDGQGGL